MSFFSVVTAVDGPGTRRADTNRLTRFSHKHPVSGEAAGLNHQEAVERMRGWL